MGKFANFYDGVSALLDKLADKIDPGKADVKSANYSTSVLDSLERIADNYDPEAAGSGVILAYRSYDGDGSGYLFKDSGLTKKYKKSEVKSIIDDGGMICYNDTGFDSIYGTSALMTMAGRYVASGFAAIQDSSFNTYVVVRSATFNLSGSGDCAIPLPWDIMLSPVPDSPVPESGFEEEGGL